MFEALIIASLVLLTAALYGFFRPRGVFRFTLIALMAAAASPFVLGFALAPFLGDGAGMGVAFILVALSALIAGAGISAALGAAAGYGWRSLR